MSNALIKVPVPSNEPIYSYAPGTARKESLKARLKKMLDEKIEIPLIIGGKEIRTGNLSDCRCPHDHGHLLGQYHKAGPKEIDQAVEEAKKAWKEWAEMDWVSRVSVFLRAAELLATKYRNILYYMSQIYAQQPDSSASTWNYMEYRALEGFVFAVTPFNFTSIAGNLPTSPAMMGNTVLWKPASSAVYSAYYLTQLWKESGLPDGVINFIPGPGRYVGDPVLEKPDLAGVHFTGSTSVFQEMWKTIGANIMNYRSYPRIVGETGGKDFVFVHASADVEAVVTALIRGAYEYQGQKCSAASRAYVSSNLWPSIKERLLEEIKTIKMGDVTDFSNFIGAIIDKLAFDSIVEYIEFAKKSAEADIICGGEYDDSKGYFIKPTIVEAFQSLRYAAGNFYINDKPTGAVVSQQPFGGARGSGTNDKAGSFLNLLRWTSARAVKENLNPPKDYRYPFMSEK